MYYIQLSCIASFNSHTITTPPYDQEDPGDPNARTNQLYSVLFHFWTHILLIFALYLSARLSGIFRGVRRSERPNPVRFRFGAPGRTERKFSLGFCQGTLLCTFLVFHCGSMSGHCTSLFCDLGCDKSLVSISLGFPLPRSVLITRVYIIIS